ncbi:hypothetical protein AR9_g175 [Bacillus phage AR9]|uniref:Uncharacterized protein n=2 Tax=Bacillus phage PBS1 TaxID=10683 RepID=A0A172JI88_BPPB1|nr:hypothetical protein BI022_gp174 [Bacillus phage AR9]YP_009664265.1 gluconate kinase [Bacillus phage PBS1]AMS01259.1 hypothetical protein AR9_g175 [Bacillus phage AR9]AST99885.1 gluconate kinase [Bacillus phage PBS1]BDE75295.1 hypothetical protein [Bacillus phage PBS1]
MDKHQNIIEFIGLIRGSDAKEILGSKYRGVRDDQHSASYIIKEIYTNGNCGQLVKLLKHVYPETKPILITNFIDPKTKEKFPMYHIVADIDNKIYDIDGEFMNSNLNNYEHKYLSDDEFKNEKLENYSFKNRGALEN